MAERKSIPYAERKFDKKNKMDYDNNYISENYDRVTILVPKGYKEIIKDTAKENNMSMAEWIKTLIDEKLNS